MSLVSMTYRIKQQIPHMFQFETESNQNGPKPIFLRQLRRFRALGTTRRTCRRTSSRSFSQVERNEFSLVGTAKNRAWKKSSQQNPSAAEGNSCGERQPDDDDAQNDDVHQQVGNVVLLVEISIFIPGDAGVIVHGAKQRLGITLRQRTGRDGDDWSSALGEKRPDVYNSGDSGLGWGSVMSGINAPQMFCSQSRRRILNQHERGRSARSGILPEHHFRARSEIDQLRRKRRADHAESHWSLRVFLGIRNISVVRHKS